MGWLLDELTSQAGPNAEAEVRAAAKRGRERLEPMLREFTGLRLSTDNERAIVSVELNPGLPTAWQKVDASPEQKQALLLSKYLPDLRMLVASSDKVLQLLRQLARTNQAMRQPIQLVTDTRSFANGLYEQGAANNFVAGLFKYDADLLGAYVIPLRGSFTTRIELYWAVIGFIARQLECSTEALTLAVLIHELAHAYTHLGADIEGWRWDSPVFNMVHLAVKEGLAQYYTYLVAKRLQDRSEPGMFEAYTRLLDLQSATYHAHLPWKERFSMEAIRAALLEFRSKGETDYYVLTERMSSAMKRLRTPVSDQLALDLS